MTIRVAATCNSGTLFMRLATPRNNRRSKMLDHFEVFTATLLLMDGTAHVVHGIVAADKYFADRRAREIAGFDSFIVNRVVLRAEGVHVGRRA